MNEQATLKLFRKPMVCDDVIALNNIPLDLTPNEHDEKKIKSMVLKLFFKLMLPSMLLLLVWYAPELKGGGAIQNFFDDANYVWSRQFIFICTFCYFSLRQINHYVLFYRQIKPHLKLGEVVDGVIKKSVRLGYLTFLLTLFCLSLSLNILTLMLSEIIAFLAALIVMKIYSSIEINRLGVGVLTRQIKSHIHKSNKTQFFKLWPYFT